MDAFHDIHFFIGFEKMLQDIKRYLQSRKNISIVGTPFSGKSTLLKRIEHEGPTWLHHVTIDRIPLYSAITLNELKTNLNQRLGGEKLSDLGKVIASRRLILLLDDIHLLDKGKKGLEVRGWLRSVAHGFYGQTVQLVTTSDQPLNEIFEKDKAVQSSPFHQIMRSVITLKEFTRGEARQFITERLAGTRFSVEDFSDVLDSVWTPGDLQDACRVWFDELCRTTAPSSRQYEAFMLYTSFDNEHNMQALEQMCVALRNEVQAHTGEPFRIFQDVDGIKWGQKRAQVIDDVIKDVLFLIPVITPSFFKSEHCRHVLQAFLAREQEQGRNDLILPVHYMEYTALQDLKQANDPLMRDIAERHPADWRDLRFSDMNAPDARQMLSAMATEICEAMQRG